MSLARSLALLACALMLGAAPAAAQQNWSKLNPWRVVCDKGGKCQVFHELRRGDASPSHLRLYKLGDAEVLEFRIPLGIDLRKGVAFRVDRKKRFPATLLTCKANGCFGFTIMNTVMLRALAEGGELDIVYTDSDSDRVRALTYSLVGFSLAYNEFFAQ